MKTADDMSIELFNRVAQFSNAMESIGIESIEVTPLKGWLEMDLVMVSSLAEYKLTVRGNEAKLVTGEKEWKREVDKEDTFGQLASAVRKHELLLGTFARRRSKEPF
jgi:hypothetical protein